MGLALMVTTEFGRKHLQTAEEIHYTYEPVLVIRYWEFGNLSLI